MPSKASKAFNTGITSCALPQWMFETPRWVAEAERLAGHSLDGNEPSRAKFSMDAAYAAWKSGAAPEEYVASFRG